MANSSSFSERGRRALALAGGAAVLAALSACNLPLGLGQPTTRALESGAADTLAAANSFEITGSYTESASQSNPPASAARTSLAGAHLSLDLQVVRPTTEHVVVNAADVKLEAIILGDTAYFRGNQFLAQHMGNDILSRNLVKAAGNAWWKGSAGNAPRLPNLIDGGNFRATFLGSAATQRTDHVSVDGIDAVELSGPRADVFIAAGAPHTLLRVHLKKGVVVDGISEGDFRFDNFDRDFKITAPTDVIDFSNLSTLPPIYTVVYVDTSRCALQCVVSALLKNLGGISGARAPSTITFTMNSTASGKVAGTCQAKVQPDVGYNSTTTVTCTIANVNSQLVNAATVTAAAENPGRA